MNVRNLVIVESGAKAKTISKYLNTPQIVEKHGKFNVIASNGHIRDLAKTVDNKLGFNVDTFTPVYTVISSKSKVIRNLKDNIKSHDVIWLAADQDREGEAIAWHIKDYYKLTNYKRITFNEITQSAIKNAIDNHRDIDYNIVDAQQCRRILDRLVGFKLTELLWKLFNSSTTLSAGRVQSVVLKIIIDKELQIKEHKSLSYWKIEGDFVLDGYAISCDLYENDKIYKITESKSIERFFKSLSDKYAVDKKSTDLKRTNVKPDLPFITSTLQQSAHNIGFSLSKTMKIAQELYEAGHITYMRTDSFNLSQDAMNKIEKYITNTFGSSYFKNNNHNAKSKSKNSQEAHEAIRPTNIQKDIPKLTKDQKLLYDLIFKRTIASQIAYASYEELLVCLVNSGLSNKFRFIGKIKVLVYEGYLIVYGEKPKPSIEKRKQIIQNTRDITQKHIIAKNVHSVPPQRYNESSIIKCLEKLGIGRPSTYANMLTKLFERQFIVKKDDIGNKKIYIDYSFQKNKITVKKEERDHYSEKNKLTPTDSGNQVCEYLCKYFPKLIDVDFTNLMESDLDKIADSEKTMTHVLKTFYDPFIKTHYDVIKSITRGSKNVLNSYQHDHVINNNTYVIRTARFGPVIQKDKLFIDLKPYLNDTNKNIEEIDISDVKFLISIPRKISKDMELNYGRYGFYIKFSDDSKKTYRIYKQFIPNLLKNDYSFIAPKKTT